ncbi:Fic family protein [Patescibacteria group bacterium]|nr:Fic family protein [Patescibacteria group bacterium]
MFSPTIPYNDLPLLPGSYNFHKPEHIQLALRANQALGKLDGLSLLLPDYTLLISPLLAKESVASNAIENINTTTIEFLQKEATGSKLSGAEKEVAYYRTTLLQGMSLLEKEGGISTNMLIHLQAIIEPDKTGIRKIPGTVIANSTGEVLYTPPEGEHKIRDLLANLESWINSNDGIDSLIKMPVIHYQFESIHPFYDGNGRIGRVLMMLYLMLTKKIQKPVLFLSSYILQHKQEYYLSLKRGEEEHNYDSIITFLLTGIIEQAQVTQEKIIAINACLNKYIGIFQQLKLRDYHLLATTFFRSAFVSINTLTEISNLSRQSLSLYIKKLEDKGVVKTIKV